MQVKAFPIRLMARLRLLAPLIEVRVLGGELYTQRLSLGMYTYTMPNAPKTPTRTIRVSDQLWTAVQKKAAAEKITVTSIIIEALENYIKED